MNEALLRIEGLGLTIAAPDGDVTALHKVDLALKKGRTLGLVGESGSGKSMTAQAVLGLNPPGVAFRRRGRIQFDGEDISHGNERQLRSLRGSRIGIIFQEPMSCLNPLMRVERQVREALRQPPFRFRQNTRQRILDLLKEVGLRDAALIARRYPHQLSGGQQQRVMIAMALAGDPDLLIADEPTTALDVTVQARIITLLKRLQRERDMAMLFISHDLALVGAIADDVAVMRHGEVVEFGPPENILHQPQHPYTRTLVAAMPQNSDGSSTWDRRRGATTDDVPILEVEKLTVTYRSNFDTAKQFVALDGVSLSVAQGQTLGLVGESGCGKSTLARAIVRLIKPASGRIHLFGKDLATLSTKRTRETCRRCQLIFQNPAQSLNPRLTIQQILEEPLEVHNRIPTGGSRAFLTTLLEEVGLGGQFLSRYPHQMSGGQKQRINIARALALDPDIMICDEIVSALDTTVQARILTLLDEIQRQRGITLLFISHDLHVVRQISDRIAIMRMGRIVETGATNEVFRNPKADYTRDLLIAGGLLTGETPTLESGR